MELEGLGKGKLYDSPEPLLARISAEGDQMVSDDGERYGYPIFSFIASLGGAIGITIALGILYSFWLVVHLPDFLDVQTDAEAFYFNVCGFCTTFFIWIVALAYPASTGGEIIRGFSPANLGRLFVPRITTAAWDLPFQCLARLAALERAAGPVYFECKSDVTEWRLTVLLESGEAFRISARSKVYDGELRGCTVDLDIGRAARPELWYLIDPNRVSLAVFDTGTIKTNPEVDRATVSLDETFITGGVEDDLAAEVANFVGLVAQRLAAGVPPQGPTGPHRGPYAVNAERPIVEHGDSLFVETNAVADVAALQVGRPGGWIAWFLRMVFRAVFMALPYYGTWVIPPTRMYLPWIYAGLGFTFLVVCTQTGSSLWPFSMPPRLSVRRVRTPDRTALTLKNPGPSGHQHPPAAGGDAYSDGAVAGDGEGRAVGAGGDVAEDGAGGEVG